VADPTLAEIPATDGAALGRAMIERDHDYRLGEDAGLRGLPLPSDGYTDPNSAHRHWQRVRGYEAGERLRKSPEYRAGYARGRSALASGSADQLQHAAYHAAAACGGELGPEESGYFYAVFGGELGEEGGQ
jgi:hypothetical protein